MTCSTSKKNISFIFALCVMFAPSGAGAAFNFFTGTDPVPKTITELGLYSDIAAKTISDDVIPYSINVPMWHDGAWEERYIALPPGAQVVFNGVGSDYFEYPVGTTFIKNVFIDTVPGQQHYRLVETQVLQLDNSMGFDNWRSFVYVWDEGQTEGTLNPVFLFIDFFVSDFNVYPGGVGTPAENFRMYHVDSVSCTKCHGTGVGGPVNGFLPAQLNRPSIPDPAVNQIQHFFDIGVFASPAEPVDIATVAKWAALNDETATLEHRSRSYLAANCSYCHGHRGHIEGVTFNLDYADGVPVPGGLIYEQATSSWMEQIGGSYLIEPAAPEKSILLYRANVRDTDLGEAIPEQMPFSNATIYTDSLADTVISGWINSLTGISRQSQPAVFSRPVLSRNFLNIPMPVDGREVTSVNLYDVNGSAIPLLRRTERLYEVSEPLKPGLYMAEINGNSFKYVVQ